MRSSATRGLERNDLITRLVEKTTEKIETAMEPFHVAREFLTTIPRDSALVAHVIVAETEADKSAFEISG